MKNIVLVFLLNFQILFCIKNHKTTLPKITRENIENEYLLTVLKLQYEELQKFQQLFKNYKELNLKNWLTTLPAKPVPIQETSNNSNLALQAHL